MDKRSFDDESSSASDSYRLLGGGKEFTKRKSFLQGKWQFFALVLNCFMLIINTVFTVCVFSKVSVNAPAHSNWYQVQIPSHGMHLHCHMEKLLTIRTGYTDEAIKWELRPFDDVFHDHESLYRGPPRPELDRAWQNLMKGQD